MKYFMVGYNYYDNGDVESGPRMACSMVVVASINEEMALTVAHFFTEYEDTKVLKEVTADDYIAFWQDIKNEEDFFKDKEIKV